VKVSVFPPLIGQQKEKGDLLGGFSFLGT